MSQPKSLAELKAMCGKGDKLRAVTKETIENILLSQDTDPGGQDSDNENDPVKLLRNLTKDVKSMKDTNMRIVAALNKIDGLETKVEQLQEDNRLCYGIITQQQMFLESLDARDRGKNIVITGIEETVNDLGGNDSEKVHSVLQEIGEQVDRDSFTTKRLGRNNDRNRRPLLVTLPSKNMRQNILEKAKLLKEKQDPYKKVYIKKDVHPAMRRELDRLRKREREEKANPNNHHKDIIYDHKQRVLTCDGQVIDRYNPTFF
jgi:hypothetical protein